MPRRASGKRKKSRSARRAQAGQVGVPLARELPSGQYASKVEKRLEKKRDLDDLNAARTSKSQHPSRDKPPYSFVIHRGKVGKYVSRLVHDVRRVMEPYTAGNLKVLRRNNLKDFIVNGVPLGVTHLVVLTRSSTSVNLRLLRVPHGPTLTFRVNQYTLAKDVVSAQKRPVIFDKQFAVQPLVVMNNFASSVEKDKKHLHLVQTMFQNMFPSINIDTIDLSKIRRCVLMNYDEETSTIDFRHYTIKAVPSGVTKSTKKLVQSKVPNLARYKDISDFYLKPEALSDSEYELDQKEEVTLPQNLSTRGCEKGQKTSVRLVELGPRMTLELLKIEEGVDEGEVLYHSYIHKSSKELSQIRKGLGGKRKAKKRMQIDEEHRVIRKLKMIEDRQQKEVQRVQEKTNEMVAAQRAVTGEVEPEAKTSAPNSADTENSVNNSGKRKLTKRTSSEKGSKRPKSSD